MQSALGVPNAGTVFQKYTVTKALVKLKTSCKLTKQVCHTMVSDTGTQAAPRKLTALHIDLVSILH